MKDLSGTNRHRARFATRGLPGRRGGLPIGLCVSLVSLVLATGPIPAQDAAVAGTGGATGTQIRAVLGLRGANNVGAGEAFKLGVALALTGPQSYVGTMQANGARLAAAQIKGADGPDIELVFKDLHPTAPGTGARAVRELGDAGVPAVLTSDVGDFGAMFPGLSQYRMLGLDGGSGTADFGQGQPYFWGTRAIEPDDDFSRALTYWTKTNPAIRKVSLVYADQGPANARMITNFS